MPLMDHDLLVSTCLYHLDDYQFFTVTQFDRRDESISFVTRSNNYTIILLQGA